MKIVEVKHPLIQHKLGLMRDHDISTKRFRELASEVSSLLTYEATADLETETVTIEGWCGSVEIEQIKGKKNHSSSYPPCRYRDDGWSIRKYS